jgi:hypothetical protein
MAYSDIAALQSDADFNSRLAACVIDEALGKPASYFTDLLLRNSPSFASSVFGPTVASAPGFGDKYSTGGQVEITDQDLLSAVQASWDRLAALYPEPE